MRCAINIAVVFLIVCLSACSHKTEVAAYDSEASAKAIEKASKEGASQKDYAAVLTCMDNALNSLEGVVDKALDAESEDDLNALEKDYDGIMKTAGKQLSEMGQLMEKVKLDDTNKAELERLTLRGDGIMKKMLQVGRKYQNAHNALLPGGEAFSNPG